MEATAKYNYDANEDDELSFRKGDVIKITGTDDDWYTGELNGNKGLVPKTFIDITLPSWYQQNISRSEASNILKKKPPGSFLIRGSQSSPGDFSISVRQDKDMQHFKVMQDSEGMYYLWTEKFLYLNQLVEYYKKNSVVKHSTLFLLDTEQQKTGGTDLPPVAPLPDHSAHPSQVRALYSFNAEENDELDFSAGDIIEVIERSDSSWWRGRLQGRTGLFPSNYTTSV